MLTYRPKFIDANITHKKVKAVLLHAMEAQGGEEV
jgi:hypothetical protein